MSLHLRRWPRPGFGGDGPPLAAPPTLMLLHGFTQNVNCWGTFADALASRLVVDAVDCPGHGATDPSHDFATLWDAADLVAERIAAQPDVASQSGRAQSPPAESRTANGTSRTVAVGYSMGGRLALHVALRHPDMLSGLVLIGATPGIEDNEARGERRRSDQELAGRLRSQPLDLFLDQWLANPLFATLSAEAAARSARLQNRRGGLAASLESCGTGSQDSLWGRLAELQMPVLLITGRDDRKFGALAEKMTSALIDAQVTSVPVDGNHAVHLERPAETADLILRWVGAVF